MMWTNGVGHTEKSLGLKQKELKKICEKFEIPRPSSGYWTSLKLGKQVEKTVLPSNNNDSGIINTDDYITKEKAPKLPMRVGSQKDAEGKYQAKELPSNEARTSCASKPKVTGLPTFPAIFQNFSVG